VRLLDVYEIPAAGAVMRLLYQYMQDRLNEPGTNISHTQMPTYEDHERFVESKPYAGWYFIESDALILVGVCYITRDNEVGIYINRDHRRQGWAPKALQELMKKHPAKQYLAHINPQNEASKIAFKRLGFGLLQETYSLRSDYDRD
jgi:RimJ/RimL family protein N-acetyltransferase